MAASGLGFSTLTAKTGSNSVAVVRLDEKSLAQTLNAFRKLGVSAADIREVTRPVARAIADQAKPRAPRKSGRLQKSVKGVGGRTSIHVKAGGKSGNTAAYAAVQEYGWKGHGIEGQKFLRTARDRNLDWALQELEQGILELAAAYGFHIE